MTFMVLTLIALSWVTFDLRTPAAATGGPREGALQLFAPVQQALAALIRPVDGAAGWIADQRRLHGELADLRAVRTQARSAEAVNADLAAENRELRRLLSMRARGAYRAVGASVLGAAPGDPAGTVVLTAGAADGVAPDMAVVNDEGFVGRVVAVTRSYARAELVTSPTARYAVRVAGAPPGRLWGGRSLLRLEVNDPHRAVRPGAPVVTRAFEGSPVPDGLPIGRVMSDPAHGRYLDVRPLVDTTSLSLVQVIVGAPDHPTTDAIGSAGPSPPLPPPARRRER
jgi:rod shape-determining protein MreC